MSTHNIGIDEKMMKIIFKLSSNIIKYTPYLFFLYCNGPKFSDRQVRANSADPDQTAYRAVRSGSQLFYGSY